MPKIRFSPDGNEVEVPVGTTILEAARKCGAQVGSACGGVCACSTCHVYVRQGEDLLTEMQDDENDRLDLGFDVRPQSRLGCQAKITKDGLVVVEITQESRKAYLDEHPEQRKKAG